MVKIGVPDGLIRVPPQTVQPDLCRDPYTFFRLKCFVDRDWAVLRRITEAAISDFRNGDLQLNGVRNASEKNFFYSVDAQDELGAGIGFFKGQRGAGFARDD